MIDGRNIIVCSKETATNQQKPAAASDANRIRNRLGLLVAREGRSK